MPTADPKKAVVVVIGVVVAALMMAYVLPIAIGAVNDDAKSTYNQSVGEEVTVNPGLNGTLDSVGANNATVTVSSDNDTATATVSEGSNETVTVGGTDVTITANTVESASADLTYEYPTTTGWGVGATAIFGLIPLLLVLVPFVLLALWAIESF